MQEKQLVTILQSGGYSTTHERSELFNILASENTPISMSKLVNLSEKSMNKSTVYRNLEIFEKLGVTHRVNMGWKYKIELSDKFRDHHHHITCQKCGRIETFHEPKSLDKELQNLAKETGFSITSHSLEISGVCSDCQV